jgi:hypothetical protein
MYRLPNPSLVIDVPFREVTVVCGCASSDAKCAEGDSVVDAAA